tara:strand:- start:1857 stop:2306 length:450 start_codon:yes stop_codon:yes gene_type:complete
MAHFAKIDSDNKVLSIMRVNDNDLKNSDGVEQESIGQQYLETHSNWPANQWIQTSYNTFENSHKLGGTPFRGNYAAIGGSWDSTNNIFWNEKPYDSWVKNISEAKWQSPIGDAPALTSEQQSQNDAGTHLWVYFWNESNETWDLTNTIS